MLRWQRNGRVSVRTASHFRAPRRPRTLATRSLHVHSFGDKPMASASAQVAPRPGTLRNVPSASRRTPFGLLRGLGRRRLVIGAGAGLELMPDQHPHGDAGHDEHLRERRDRAASHPLRHGKLVTASGR